MFTVKNFRDVSISSVTNPTNYESSRLVFVTILLFTHTLLQKISMSIMKMSVNVNKTENDKNEARNFNPCKLPCKFTM